MKCRRSATINPHRLQPRDGPRLQQCQKRDEQPQANDNRHPGMQDQRHVQLSAHIAVVFIVMMRLLRQPRLFRCRRFLSILRCVHHFVHVLQRAGAKPQQADDQENGSELFQTVITRNPKPP